MNKSVCFPEGFIMSLFKRLTACLCLAALLISVLCIAASAQGEMSVSAHSAVLMDAHTGTILFEKGAHTRLPMASTTKIMTALTALSIADPQTVITVPPEAVGVEGSSIYLCEGEQLTLEQLLYAVMLESANDASVAVAVGLCGSVDAFAEKMNACAASLGLRDSLFQNPHGLDAEGHYTTAYELAVIAMHALNNELIAKMASTKKTTIPHDGTDGVRLLVNHNRMLRYYDGAIGVKTGYTKKSGRCLVSAAERDGVRLIAVTLNASNDWIDHASLLDYGFTQRKSVLLCRENEICMTLPVIGGDKTSVTVSNPQALSVSLPTACEKVEQSIELPRFLYASVSEGETVGRVLFFCDTDGDGVREVLGEAPLIAQGSVERQPVKRGFWQWLCSLFGF